MHVTPCSPPQYSSHVGVDPGLSEGMPIFQRGAPFHHNCKLCLKSHDFIINDDFNMYDIEEGGTDTGEGH